MKSMVLVGTHTHTQKVVKDTCWDGVVRSIHQPAETLLLIEPHSVITLQLVGGDMSSDVMLLCSTCVFC
jgi:hypothetical protein